MWTSSRDRRRYRAATAAEGVGSALAHPGTRPTVERRRPRAGRGARLGAAFGALTGALLLGWLVATQAWVGRWDVAVVHDVAADRSTWLTPLVLRFTDLAGTTVLSVITGAVIAVLAAIRRVRVVAALTVALVASAAVVLGTKQIVARPRPPASLMVGPVEHGFSFPSGHTTVATAVLLVGAALIARAARRSITRAAVRAGAALAVAGVAASRVYLGYHWLTDVVAGALLGAAVAALTLLLVTDTTLPSGWASAWRRGGRPVGRGSAVPSQEPVAAARTDSGARRDPRRPSIPT